MGPFDMMFDLNHDGMLDAGEMAVEMMFLDDVVKNENNAALDEEDEEEEK